MKQNKCVLIFVYSREAIKPNSRFYLFTCMQIFLILYLMLKIEVVFKVQW